MRMATTMLVAGALMAGCDAVPTTQARGHLTEPQEGDVRATISANVVRAGGTVSVRFENSGTETYIVAACGRRVERLVDGVWKSYGEELRLCIASGRVLSAGGNVADETDVPVDAVAGLHRLRFVFPNVANPNRPPAEFHSNTFTVEQ